jgi:chemotaxis signal transduction protein
MNAAQPGTDSKPEEKPRLRDLFSFVAGGRIFAVLAEEVEGTADAKYAALLPHAPPAVVGVLCVRGRMLTTLDPIALVTGRRLEWPPVIPSVVALRGDEQLALAAERFGGTITVAEADIEAPAEDGDRNHPAIIGISRHGGEEISILGVSHLFAAAFQRKERRRRRY